MPIVAEANIRVNKPLTNFSLERKQQGSYIADLVYPVFPVDKKSDLYYTNDLRPLDAGTEDEDLRGETAPTTSMPPWTADPVEYRCRTRALMGETATESEQELQEIFDLRQIETERTLLKMELKREVRIRNGCFVASDYAAANKVTVDGSTIPYFDSATGDPLKTIESAKSKVIASGVVPTHMIVPYPVFAKLKWLPRMLTPFYGVQVGMLNEQQLGDLFGLTVVVPMTQVNSAAMGLTDSIGYIWDTNIWVGNINPNPTRRSRQFALTFSRKIDGTGGRAPRVRSEFNPKKGYGVWEDTAEWDIDEVVTDRTCGCIIATPFTP